MQNIKITVPLNNKDYSFSFRRDMDGKGGWVALDKMGTNPPNIYAPIELSETLSVLAREKGLTEAHDFAICIPSKKEEKIEKTAKVKNEKKVAKKLKKALAASSFNPFQMSF